MEIPKNTFNSLRKRVWLAESKSTRNTLWGASTTLASRRR